MNCGAFGAGLIEGILCGAEFVSRRSVADDRGSPAGRCHGARGAGCQNRREHNNFFHQLRGGGVESGEKIAWRLASAGRSDS